VAAPDLEVVGIVTRGDLQGAGAEVGLDVVVGDDLQLPAGERQHDLLSHQPRVPLIGGIDRHCGVGEHRLRPHRGDDHLSFAVGQRVGDRVERVGDLPLLDLQVGDCRAAARVPVDQVVVAVDQALGVQVAEDLTHGTLVALVEREALAPVVARGAEPGELVDDRSPVLAAPVPDALDEGLSAEVLA